MLVLEVLRQRVICDGKGWRRNVCTVRTAVVTLSEIYFFLNTFLWKKLRSRKNIFSFSELFLESLTNFFFFEIPGYFGKLECVRNIKSFLVFDLSGGPGEVVTWKPFQCLGQMSGSIIN